MFMSILSGRPENQLKGLFTYFQSVNWLQKYFVYLVLYILMINIKVTFFYQIFITLKQAYN